jgi:hypothetical protein
MSIYCHLIHMAFRITVDQMVPWQLRVVETDDSFHYSDEYLKIRCISIFQKNVAECINASKYDTNPVNRIRHSDPAPDLPRSPDKWLLNYHFFFEKSYLLLDKHRYFGSVFSRQNALDCASNRPIFNQLRNPV